MNPNYIHTITLYNCLRAKDNPNGNEDVWYRTVLENCFYKCVVIQKQYINSSPQINSTYVARIPRSDRYRPYKEWCKLPEAERKKCFTCNERDLVVYETCQEEISGKSPNTAAQVLDRNKPDAFVVKAFSDDTSHLCDKHYRLGG